MVRYAFTMIELIFALVIMGVVFITLPMILINNSSNVERNLIQEAIFASSTKLGQILSYTWDENSIDSAVSLSASHVLNTPGGDVELNRVGASDFRIGHFVQDLHRRMTPNSAQRNATAIGAEVVGEMNDIDDFHNAGTTELISFTNDAGYKKTYRIKTTVAYVTDEAIYNANTINFTFNDNTSVTAAAGATNIKLIEISTDQNNTNTGAWDPILVLRTYSSNIGETDYYKRTY